MSLDSGLVVSIAFRRSAPPAPSNLFCPDVHVGKVSIAFRRSNHCNNSCFEWLWRNRKSLLPFGVHRASDSDIYCPEGIRSLCLQCLSAFTALLTWPWVKKAEEAAKSPLPFGFYRVPDKWQAPRMGVGLEVSIAFRRFARPGHVVDRE